MIENNTDRLFWTLAAIIVGSLLLTIGLKTFPNMEHNAMSALTNITKSVNTTNPSTEQKFIGGFNPNPNDAIGTKVNPDGNATKINTDDYNAVDAQTLNLKVTPHSSNLNEGSGTGTVTGPINGTFSGNLNIPEYVKVNGQIIKITRIDTFAFTHSNLTSITLPNSITSIWAGAFANNNLTSINIPSSVENFGEGAFAGNNLTSVNIPNPQGYQDAQSNQAFDSNVNLTNNPS